MLEQRARSRSIACDAWSAPAAIVHAVSLRPRACTALRATLLGSRCARAPALTALASVFETLASLLTGARARFTFIYRPYLVACHRHGPEFSS